MVISRSKKHRLGAGILLGIATLVKAQSLLLVPLILVARPTAGRYPRYYLKTTKDVLVIITIAILVVAPWTWRNHQQFGEWIFVSSNGGINLLVGNNPSADGRYTPNDPLVTSINRNIATQIADDKIFKQRAIEWITHHPIDFIQLLPKKLFWLWAVDGESEWGYQVGFDDYPKYYLWFRGLRIFNQLLYFSILFGFIAVGLRLFKTKRRFVIRHKHTWQLLPYTIVIFPCITALGFFGSPRFHFQVMPFMVMCFSYFVVKVLLRDRLGLPWRNLHQQQHPRPSEDKT
jgi:4-amino-4-deoxy-L-arabinose transferase-like glycosyltransferase